MPEHKDLQDSQLHEPKGAVSASKGSVYTSDGSGSGTWERSTGYVAMADGEHTEASPLTITGGDTIQFTVDATLTNRFNGISGLWSTVTNRILPKRLNDVMLARLSFKASKEGTGNTVLGVDFKFSDGSTFHQTQVYLPRDNLTNTVSIDLPLYVGETFFETGGVTIHLTAEDTVDIWDKSIFITRLHKGI